MFFHLFFDRRVVPFIIFVFDADNFGAVLMHFELFFVSGVAGGEEARGEEGGEG